MTNEEVARAFSGHRFEEVFDHLAPDVVWNLIGDRQLTGRDAVVEACRDTLAAGADMTTTWLRFVSAGTGDVVAVDAIGRYEGPDSVVAVSSCDIYEFSNGVVHTITSYFALVKPDDPTAGGPKE